MPPTDLRFERAGNGPVLLLLHGLGSNLRIWDPVRPLLERRRDVIAVDLPGHGGSALPAAKACSPSELARSLEVFCDDLGIDTAHLAGNSLGGWVALELAKRGRARSVTALSPAGLWRQRAPMYNVITFRAYRTLGRRMRRLLPFLASNPITRTILFWRFFGRPWAVPAGAAMDAAAGFLDSPGFDAVFAAASKDCFRGGRTIDIPVTIAWGARDALLLPWQARFRDEVSPRTRWMTLPGCGHVPTFDDPAAVASVILETSEA